MNLGQALGELQLEIATLKERKGIRAEPAPAQSDGITDVLNDQVRRLRAELETSQTSEIAALAKIGVYKREAKERDELIAELRNVADQLRTQSQLRQARFAEASKRIARLEAATKAIPSLDSGELGRVKEQAAEYKRHIERMEADARGDGMQISELRRKLDQAVMLAGKLQQEIDELLKQPAKVVEVASQSAECQTCAPIIRAIAQAVTASNEPQAVPMPMPVPCERPSEMLPSRPTSIKQKILKALRDAEVPATAAQIGEHIGIPGQIVQQNIYHSVKTREVMRLEPAAKQGELDQRSFRYWLASRPMPVEART